MARESVYFPPVLACIIMVTYSPHFYNKGKSSVFLDWVKYSFAIFFTVNVASKFYLSDLPSSVGEVGDKIVKLNLFFMFIVFYIHLLRMKPKSENDFMSIGTTGDSIFTDNSNH